MVGSIVRERPEEGVRAFLCQHGMEFAVYGPPLFVVQCQLTLHDKAVHLRVGIGAEIVHPGPDLGRMEEGGNVGGVIKHPGCKDDIEVMVEKNILFPGLPFLELALYVYTNFAKIVLEGEDNALYGLTLLFYRDFQS